MFMEAEPTVVDDPPTMTEDGISDHGLGLRTPLGDRAGASRERPPRPVRRKQGGR
jgi:hypothetical protein